MKGPKTIFVCTECGAQSPKWMGKCPHCGKWNTMAEEIVQAEPEKSPARRPSMGSSLSESKATAYQKLTTPSYMRSESGLGELDRVLGGGLVLGSVVLLSGEPGIGKSTLLMQISDALGQDRKVLYVSGEESGGQLKLRAERLGVTGEHLYILTETNLEKILSEADEIKPDVMILDSIQTIYSDRINSAPGSITQVRECALTFINKAKAEGISMLLVGHVNKEGGIAGPKVLEHMVDAVLYFEGERQQAYRIIRAVKNRYGSTNEIGVFEMTDRGLDEVANPSEMLLSGRPKNVSGNCALCSMEGTRPLIAEVQALVTPTVFPSPRRTSNGVDYNRVYLILAVLEKRLGLKFYQNDVYLNVVGGLSIGEPAADLAIAAAMISSLTDRIVPDDLLVIGELGLAGEIRAVSNLEQRVREAARLGFTRAIVPFRNTEKRPLKVEGMKIIPVRGVYEVLKELKDPT
ncbi:MAG: DNA repair protein RadA [Clostridia bacterium]|nr:DNA repair protein RadA [Clostridia bacterium]MBQ9781469.1 DNA repair protein RadA [Clostridia bacterium]